MLALLCPDKCHSMMSFRTSFRALALTYKVKKYQKGKTTKTKKIINPNIMFTIFTTFCEKSPGELREDMIEWIESNSESFKTHVLMAMVSRDLDFNTWLRKARSNETNSA